MSLKSSYTQEATLHIPDRVIESLLPVRVELEALELTLLRISEAVRPLAPPDDDGEILLPKPCLPVGLVGVVLKFWLDE